MLGDENLLEAFQTIFGVTLNTYGSIDTNASIVSKLMPMSDLTDPTKLKQLTERFTAQYTLLYGPGGQDASTPLTRDLQRHDDEQPRRRDDDHERHSQRQQQLQRIVDRRAAVGRAADQSAEPVARRLSAASLRQASRA